MGTLAFSRPIGIELDRASDDGAKLREEGVGQVIWCCGRGR